MAHSRLSKPSRGQDTVENICFLEPRVPQRKVCHLCGFRIRCRIHDGKPDERGIEPAQLLGIKSNENIQKPSNVGKNGKQGDEEGTV